MPLAQSKRTLAEDSCPPCDTGRKIGAVEMALMWNLLHEDPACPSRVLLDKSAQRQAPIGVSVRHLNRLRVRWHLNRRKGRPRQAAWRTSVGSDRAVVQVTPRLSFVGVHLLAHWLDQHDDFAPVVTRLQHAIAAYKNGHPDEDFALLHHREQTLRQRFQALFFAPLLGIETLTGFDTHEHPLRTLVGRGYHSSTLTQFLGQLERINAAEALLPALLPATGGQITYVDGHMIAYWARVPMHKGKITMLGRIMAGSQALIAHNEAGHALFVAYHPPDMHLSHIIVAYCQQVVAVTGTTLFVIDRAVNSVAIVRAFAHQGWGLLSMLDEMSIRAWKALTPLRWAPLRMAPRCIAGSGKSPGKTIHGTLSLWSPLKARPWCIGGRQRLGKRWRLSCGQGCINSGARSKKTVSNG
jgi:hypothetical protein